MSVSPYTMALAQSNTTTFKSSNDIEYGQVACRSCNATIKWNIWSSRMIAIMKLPANDLWKGVVTRKGYPSKYIFEGSGRCNVSTHRGHCLTLEHLDLETYRHNARRKSHHNGARLCDCYKPCIGPNVRTCPEGGHTGMRLEWLEQELTYRWYR